MTRATPSRIAVAISTAFCLTAIASGLLFINFSVDDAFITFRYGQTFMDTGVWAWNPTGPFLPVEAYTNPLFAFLSIIPHAFGATPAPIFKVIGAVALGAVFYVGLRGVETTSKLMVASVICANYYIFAHAFSGLETVLFCAIVLYTIEQAEREPASRALSFIILLAPLVRPEGAVLSAYIFIRQYHIPASRKWAALFAALSCIYPAFRFYYFKELFPNTFYVKMADADIAANMAGEKWILLQCAIALFIIFRSCRSIILPTILAATYLFANLASDMQMNYGHRFAYHLLVPITVYAAKCTANQREHPSHFSIICLLASSIATLNLQNIKNLLDYYPNALSSHARMGMHLKELPPDTIVAVGDAGLIPYHSKLPTIDFIGLASREISSALRRKSEFSLPRPDLVVVYSNSEKSCFDFHVKFRGLQAIHEKFNTSSDYYCVPGPRWGNEYYLNGLIWKDSNKADALRAIFTKLNSHPSQEHRTFTEVFRDAMRFRGLQADFGLVQY